MVHTKVAGHNGFSDGDDDDDDDDDDHHHHHDDDDDEEEDEDDNNDNVINDDDLHETMQKSKWKVLEIWRKSWKSSGLSTSQFLKSWMIVLNSACSGIRTRVHVSRRREC